MILDIDKAKEAVAALEEAKAKCSAAGATLTTSRFRLTLTAEDNAITVLLQMIRREIAKAEYRAKPIAIGDTVLVCSLFNTHHSVGKILCVGPKIVRLLGHERTEFRVDTGRWNSPCLASHYWIDEDDLHRIKRDLVPKKRQK